MGGSNRSLGEESLFALFARAPQFVSNLVTHDDFHASIFLSGFFFRAEVLGKIRSFRRDVQSAGVDSDLDEVVFGLAGPVVREVIMRKLRGVGRQRTGGSMSLYFDGLSFPVQDHGNLLERLFTIVGG